MSQIYSQKSLCKGFNWCFTEHGEYHRVFSGKIVFFLLLSWNFSICCGTMQLILLYRLTHLKSFAWLDVFLIIPFFLSSSRPQSICLFLPFFWSHSRSACCYYRLLPLSVPRREREKKNLIRWLTGVFGCVSTKMKFLKRRNTHTHTIQSASHKESIVHRLFFFWFIDCNNVATVNYQRLLVSI